MRIQVTKSSQELHGVYVLPESAAELDNDLLLQPRIPTGTQRLSAATSALPNKHNSTALTCRGDVMLHCMLHCEAAESTRTMGRRSAVNNHQTP